MASCESSFLECISKSIEENDVAEVLKLKDFLQEKISLVESISDQDSLSLEGSYSFHSNFMSK